MTTLRDVTKQICTLHETFYAANVQTGQSAPKTMTNRQDYTIGHTLLEAITSSPDGLPGRALILRTVEELYEPEMDARFRGYLAHSDTHFWKLTDVVMAFESAEIRDDLGAWAYTVPAAYGREFSKFFLGQAVKGMSKEEGERLAYHYRDALKAASAASPDLEAAKALVQDTSIKHVCAEREFAAAVEAEAKAKAAFELAYAKTCQSRDAVIASMEAAQEAQGQLAEYQQDAPEVVAMRAAYVMVNTPGFGKACVPLVMKG